MAKRKKGLTPNRIAYNREVSRIRKQLKRMYDRGYDVFYKLPERPKTIQPRTIEKLKEITTDYLYKHSQFVDMETGEILTGEQGRVLERSRSAQKGAETKRRKKQEQDSFNAPYNPTYNEDFFYDVIISQYKTYVLEFDSPIAGRLIRWLDDLLAKYGKEEVTGMLQYGAEHGLIVDYRIMYSDENSRQYMTEMLNYLPDLGQLERDELIDAIESGEYWYEPD